MQARRHSNHDKLRDHPEECEAMTSAMDPTRLVPGFDFLQGLMKGGGAGLPGIGQWIAPTLEPEELQKRIDELRTVQFWLEQNAKLIGTTIQALEVQRMTLATLKGMNLQMADLADSLKLRPLKAASADSAAAPRPVREERAAPDAAREAEAADGSDAPEGGATRRAAKAGAAKPAQSGPAAAVDPMQWWGALTQQFTELATRALKDGGAEVARNLAGAAAQQGLGAAETSIERMMALSSQAAGLAAKTGSAMVGAVGAAAAPAARAAARTRAGKGSPAAGAGQAGRTGASSTAAPAGAARGGSSRRRAA